MGSYLVFVLKDKVTTTTQGMSTMMVSNGIPAILCIILITHVVNNHGMPVTTLRPLGLSARSFMLERSQIARGMLLP